MTGASLAVATIGQVLALARGLVTKHAVKQVDRLMSNPGIDVWDSFVRWMPQQVGAQRDILVAVEWTDFDRDGQSTLVLSLVTGHGRAAPLIWLTVWKEEIATRRDDYHAKGMKEPWCLAASDPEASAAQLVDHYARRWTIEPQLRDTKDPALRHAAVGHPCRRAHAARSAATGKRLRRGVANIARRSGRMPRNGPAA